MDRRTFIQSLPCLGATTALPVFSSAGGIRPTARLEAPTTPTKSKSVSEPRIGVIAVGGAGGTILSELYGKLPYLSHSTAIDIDSVALQRVAADRRILIGAATVRPSDAHATSKLANDARAQIADVVADLDIVFIVAGMGGTAGTTISPMVAEVLREKQVITIAAAFMPFNSEGPRRHRISDAGILGLGSTTNATFEISCELLCSCARQQAVSPSPATTIFERLYLGVTAPVAEPDFLVGLDSESLRECMSNEGYAAIGIGSASGRNAAEAATRKAIAFRSLNEWNLRCASHIWALIEGAPELLRLRDVAEVMHLIRDSISTGLPDPIFFFGAIRNKTLDDDFRVTILASGIPREY